MCILSELKTELTTPVQGPIRSLDEFLEILTFLAYALAFKGQK